MALEDSELLPIGHVRVDVLLEELLLGEWLDGRVETGDVGPVREDDL